MKHLLTLKIGRPRTITNSISKYYILNMKVEKGFQSSMSYKKIERTFFRKARELWNKQFKLRNRLLATNTLNAILR